jgi:DNA primase
MKPAADEEREILIDYLRSNPTNTSICAYSPRAWPGATVSMPIIDALKDRSNSPLLASSRA